MITGRLRSSTSTITRLYRHQRAASLALDTQAPLCTRLPSHHHHHHQRAPMSSDADYTAFLDKANQDTGAGGNYSAQSRKPATQAVNTDVPESLCSVDEVYVSDADEPFEPVSLKWSGKGMPSADDMKQLLSHGAEVETVDEKGFGEYQKVIKVVKEAGNGKVAIYRVHHGSTRAEYFVISVDEDGGRVVGLKALAVES